jgi:hypothetical protein
MTIQFTRGAKQFWIDLISGDLTKKTTVEFSWRGIEVIRYVRHPRTDRVRWEAAS